MTKHKTNRRRPPASHVVLKLIVERADVAIPVRRGPLRVTLTGREFRHLLKKADRADEAALPPLPPADAEGNRPALEYARAAIARNIIRRRTAAGLSQGELAKRAGVRRETISRMETGKHTSDPATLDKVDAALKRHP